MSATVKTSSAKTNSQPHIKRVDLGAFGAIDLPSGAVVFVVGPNNGGKSTFLNEIQARVGHVTNTKWVEKVEWELGSQEDWLEYTSKYFRTDSTDDRYLKEIATGNRIGRGDIEGFYGSQSTSHPSFLVRFLNAQNRIDLANQVQAPDVVAKTKLHPYHEFFFVPETEAGFSTKIKAAFGRDFRINRTGIQVSGHLGRAPTGARLSTEYETAILKKMEPIQSFGDGVRSYTGILLNSIADARPVTIVDEPEAFLHPPQARRLGQEMALAAKETGRQVFVATHSADFIQGALSAKNPNTLFLYLDHTNSDRKIHAVDRSVVDEFSKKPFLVHTSALDALFYDQAIVCEGEADIMFFKWALEGTPVGKRLDESFWMSAYGKAAIPGILADMQKLGIHARCVFDLDVLLSPEILRKICEIFDIDFEQHRSFLATMARSIKVPPAAEALQRISSVIEALDEKADDEPSRMDAIRLIKKSAEELGKSWVLKSAGLSALPKGQIYAATVKFIEMMRGHGVLILEEGEIENYVPEIGRHGQAWVRSALEAGNLSTVSRDSITRQFKALT